MNCEHYASNHKSGELIIQTDACVAHKTRMLLKQAYWAIEKMLTDAATTRTYIFKGNKALWRLYTHLQIQSDSGSIKALLRLYTH